MRRFISLFKSLWPIIALIFLALIIFATNYVPGTWLLGWDNVMPEFNFKVNFLRSLFGVWQEHRGLGLYDGMSHVATFLHTGFIWILSFVITQQLLRYVFHLLVYLIGGIGMYTLLQQLLHPKTAIPEPASGHTLNSLQDLNEIPKQVRNDTYKKMLALSGSLFYLLNPATIQMFYVPMEVFSIHFAGLPWISYVLLRYLIQPTRKSLFYFALTAFLVTPQYLVPTLFISTSAVLFCLFLGFLISTRAIKTTGKQAVTIAMVYFCINAFWLLPYVYGLPKNAPIIQNAKINSMSSSEIFARNRAFGDMQNVLLLRGFLLDSIDNDTQGNPTSLMFPVTHQLYQPITTVMSTFFAFLAICGFVMILLRLRKKHHEAETVGFVFVFAFGFFMLGTDIPIFKPVIDYLRTHAPILAEAFRFSFTKFSLLFVFAYSVCIVVAIDELGKLWRKNHLLRHAVPLILIGMILFITYPVFAGNFFYKNLHVKLPADYQNLFAFMNTRDPNSRVAILPQPEYWSWKHYRFGAVGSGFLWYGFPQPLLDRAFDPWSQDNENYYWELSYALYSKNPQLFQNVLEKYQVRFLILDEYLISTNHDRALFVPEIKELLGNNSFIKPVARFGKLSVYEYTTETAKSFVSLYRNLPYVTPSISTDYDAAFSEFGTYGTTGSPEIIYPFRGLSTKRAVTERDFAVTETPDSLTILSPVQNVDLSAWNIFSALPIWHTQDNRLAIELPKKTLLVSDANTTNTLYPQLATGCDDLRKGEVNAETQVQEDRSYLRLSAYNQRSCLTFSMSNLKHEDGYLVKINSRHVGGKPLLLSLINSTAKHVEVETLLPDTQNVWDTSYFILPPLANDGLGYDVYVVNDAIGRYASINDLDSLQVYRLPYRKLKQLKFIQPGFAKMTQNTNWQIQTVNHLNSFEYRVTVEPRMSYQPTMLALSQAFDPGWLAYSIPGCQLKAVSCKLQNMFPFIFGTWLTDHVLVNNWANGWQLPEQLTINNQQLTIYIFFIPQFLEFVGFIFLPLPFLWLLKKH